MMIMVMILVTMMMMMTTMMMKSDTFIIQVGELEFEGLMRMLDNSVSQTFQNFIQCQYCFSSFCVMYLHPIYTFKREIIQMFQGFRTGYTYIQPLERIEPARLANDVSLNISPFIKTIGCTVVAQWESQVN